MRHQQEIFTIGTTDDVTFGITANLAVILGQADTVDL